MTATKLSKKLLFQKLACLLLVLGFTVSSGWAIVVTNGGLPPTTTTTPTPTPKPSPTPIATIPSALVPLPGKGLTINLSKYYTLPLVSTNGAQTNTVVAATSRGNFLIQLFPANTPGTVANFLKYVTNGYYNNMLIERLVSGFVLQTGSYQADPTDTNFTFPSLATNFGAIPSEAGISNTTGTVAMALSTGPDTGSSAWFINLANNSSLLDGTNDGGPFTVFGNIVSNTMPVVSAITSLPTYSVGSFSTLPLAGVASGQTRLLFKNLVVMNGMQFVQPPYALSSNTNFFSAAFQGTNLIVTPLAPNITGPVTITLYTTDTNANPVYRSFQVSTTKFPQTINFPYFDQVTNPTALYSLTNSPTVSSGSSIVASGLPVTISVSGPASMTNIVTNGVTNSMIKFSGAGWVQLIAKQPGNLFYNAAPPVNGWIEVYKTYQTISFTNIPAQTFVGKSPLVLTNYPSASSGLPVTVSVKSGPAKMIPGGHGQPAHALTLLGTGTVTLIASQSGNALYYPALTKTNSFVVTPPAP